LCGIGICYECRVTIDRIAHCRSCQIPCRSGMQVITT
jgi:D-hydroxyproline dehydrogenase subunit gamma